MNSAVIDINNHLHNQASHYLQLRIVSGSPGFLTSFSRGVFLCKFD